ncbi:hypothetical protein ACPSKX_04050 [Moritella viscosa]
MDLCKSAILLTTLFTLSAQAAFYAIVMPPKGMYKEPSAELNVTQETDTGTYSVTNAELIFSETLISDEGCDVELVGDETSGTWTYYNSLACSDDDKFTLLATKGLSNTVTVFKNSSCDYLANGWLAAAHNGTGTGLIYNEGSINIDIFSTGEGEEGVEPTTPDEGEGEGSVNPEFNLPELRWVYDDIVVDHPFLIKLDLSNLTYVLGDTIILRGMKNLTSFDLSSLRNYNNTPLNINIMGAMSAKNLDISRLSYSNVIDISYTSISDISTFSNLRTGTIITNNDSEAFFPQITTFPSRNSIFCKAVRWGDITLSSSISQSNAESSCQ